MGARKPKTKARTKLVAVRDRKGRLKDVQRVEPDFIPAELKLRRIRHMSYRSRYKVAEWLIRHGTALLSGPEFSTYSDNFKATLIWPRSARP